MAEQRTFRIVLVKDGHGAGLEPTSAVNAEINYKGKEVHATIE
jgi:hypothetical protein